VTFEDLARSVIAVPPLAQTAGLTYSAAENKALIGHLETAGVSTLMYGGNANFYNLPISDYELTLGSLIEAAAQDTWLIPALGPDYGRMVDQVPVLRALGFPTAMTLPPYPNSYTAAGYLTALRNLSDKLGAPFVIYAKHNNAFAAGDLRKLVDDGVVAFVKYAVVRPDPADDGFLRSLVDAVDPRRIISGIGERPVIVHFEQFGLTSFTSGSVAVAPRQSLALLRALQAGDRTAAEAIRARFLPLEDCRDRYGPARVLHEAVSLCGIADCGPLSPLLSNLDETERALTGPAARALHASEVPGSTN
jgi:dihydrodipicolinate synthase/N-acetylneuraminate lyase